MVGMAANTVQHKQQLAQTLQQAAAGELDLFDDDVSVAVASPVARKTLAVPLSAQKAGNEDALLFASAPATHVRHLLSVQEPPVETADQANVRIRAKASLNPTTVTVASVTRAQWVRFLGVGDDAPVTDIERRTWSTWYQELLNCVNVQPPVTGLVLQLHSPTELILVADFFPNSTYTVSIKSSPRIRDGFGQPLVASFTSFRTAEARPFFSSLTPQQTNIHFLASQAPTAWIVLTRGMCV